MLKEKHDDTGKRWYEDNGSRYDAVTTAIGYAYGWKHWRMKPSAWLEPHMEFYRRRGQLVHAAIAILARGKAVDWDTVDVECAPFLDAFGEWCLKFKPTLRDGEVRVHSDLYAYAGRLDVDCDLEHRTVVDVKCGSVNQLVGVQTSGYAHALRETSGYLAEIDRAVLYLRDDGSYDFRFCSNPSDFTHFRNALGAYRSGRELGLW